MEEKAAHAVEEAMAGGGGAADGVGDDVGEGMQCSEHPYRTNPGGICAFCLQEKLGNLLSAAAPNSFFTTTTTTPLAAATTTTTTSTAASAAADVLLLKASSNKSVAPRPLGDVAIVSADSARKKKHFWSFLYPSSSSSSATATAKINQQQQHQHQQEEEQSADAESSSGGSSLQAASSSSFGRKVGRSRSVGCGSRSFSGDFLERISTGFGDCTLRRVESQRETRKRAAAAADGKMAAQQRNVRESRIKERVRCGGIFRGLGMGSTSSSYWLSSAAEDETSNRMSSKTSLLRSRNWGWVFASPIRAFKPSSRPANTVASINISTGTTGGSCSSKISNGNPPSSLAVGGGGSSSS